MRKVRREIEIFNMSLLDILCGALGAFCFLTLTLFPFYGRVEGAGQAEVRAFDAEREAVEEQIKRLEDARASEEQEAAALEQAQRELSALQEKASKAAEVQSEIQKLQRELAALESTASGENKPVEALKKQVEQAARKLDEKKNGFVENSFLLVSARSANGGAVSIRLQGAKASAPGANGVFSYASVAEPGVQSYTAEILPTSTLPSVLALEVCSIQSCIQVPARRFRSSPNAWSPIARIKTGYTGSFDLQVTSQ
ncbi:MAG: hypothetical protein OHK0021_19650 [Bryobacter sp.]